MMRKWGLLLLGCLLVLAGSYLAHAVQTTGGVTVRDVRYPGAGSTTLSGLVYVPGGATAQHPAPAVLVSHGFINTREMQSPFAIELSRRGFVVLAMDMTGHGYSGGFVGEHGYGGPDSLAYLRSLPFVDKSNIGLEGHSMGGAPVINAALANPDGYKALVLEGSTTAFLGGPGEGATSFPHNLEVVMGQYDEFAPLMWQVAKGSQTNGSARLMKIFGTAAPVIPGKLYGDLAAGTGRRLINPAVDHPQEHFTKAGVGPAIDWFQKTLTGEASPKPPSDQIWLWKEIGTLIGFIGCVVVILGTFQALISTALPALAHAAEPAAVRWSPRWWLAGLLTGGVPAATFYPFMKIAPLVFFAPFAITKTLPFALHVFSEQITNQLVIWALLNGLIALILSFVLRRGKPVFTHRWVSAALAAILSVGAGYLALVIVDAVFKVDFRFWVLGLKPLDARHFWLFLAYLPDFTIFFLLALRAFAASVPTKDEPAWFAYVVGAKVFAWGFIVLLAVQYVTMAATGFLATPGEPLNTIIAFQFAPLLAVIGLIAAFTYRRTNDYAPGAFICALFVTWYIVAGTAVFAPSLTPLGGGKPPPAASAKAPPARH